MSKYAPLGEFLRAQEASEVPMTFADIERITGVKLPPKAQHQRAWWSNNPSNNVMTKVWLEAGYETAHVEVAARRLLFRRVRVAGVEDKPASDAKQPTRHPAFGALKGLIRIPPGVDLTEPADPEWADLIDQKYAKFR